MMTTAMALPPEAPNNIGDLRRCIKEGVIRVAEHRGHICQLVELESIPLEDFGVLLIALSGETGLDIDQYLDDPFGYLEKIRRKPGPDKGILHDADLLDDFGVLLYDSRLQEVMKEADLCWPADDGSDLNEAIEKYPDFAWEVDHALAAPEDEEHFLAAEGDWGGQMYFTCPRRLVVVDRERIAKILSLVDRIAWKCNEGEGTSWEFHPRDFAIAGMGGGRYDEHAVWVHPSFDKKIRGDIAEALTKKDPVFLSEEFRESFR